ncbi:type I DNA topoisomerase [Patescibacteria group bacterium]|nr:type I DNA topoisomerase [Patescibacteria group bacterium]
MKNLVIVESPTKARTIGKFLGKDYEIKASMGHIIDLPKSTLGVDVKNDFKPELEVIKDKKKIIAELKSAAKNVEQILLATDPDREGEAIASHIKDMLGSSSKFKRIVFHEITEGAINEALKHPREVDDNLVDAQTARRVLDRLVGYKLSPILWQKVRRGLSAGRVQSVALRLIVEREREIEKFEKEKYFTFDIYFTKASKEVVFELWEMNAQKLEVQKTFNLYDGDYTITKTLISDAAKAGEIAKDLGVRKYKVADVTKKENKRSPAPAFTTSSLQQEASRRFGYSGKRTMSLAQKLYEEGFITYHRTDSVAMAQAAIGSIRNFVQQEFGEKYIPKSPRFFKNKQKLAQEAHEAIRPTKVSLQAAAISEQLGKEYSKLYDLIWKRAVASQMSDAITESTTVFLDSMPLKEAKDDVYKLKANGSILVFDGFLKVNSQALNDTILPEFTVGEELGPQKAVDAEHDTNPPPRYNDASIISALEEKGIGRPSTYATIISTIEARKYIEREEGKFIPTSIGVAVNDFLVENFSTVDDIPFTADMEDQLDAIANGEKKWVPVMQAFWEPFEKTLVNVKDAKRVKIETEETDEICPKCGNKLVIRMGKFGKFFSCSTFPTCDFSKPFVEETGFLCPKDGGKVVVKRTRKGRKFYGCSNYPACTFAVWKLEDLKKQVK